MKNSQHSSGTHLSSAAVCGTLGRGEMQHFRHRPRPDGWPDSRGLGHLFPDRASEPGNIVNVDVDPDGRSGSFPPLCFLLRAFMGWMWKPRGICRLHREVVAPESGACPSLDLDVELAVAGQPDGGSDCGRAGGRDHQHAAGRDAGREED